MDIDFIAKIILLFLGLAVMIPAIFMLWSIAIEEFKEKRYQRKARNWRTNYEKSSK